MKTREQVYYEAQNYLEIKLEKLQKEKERVELEIQETEELLKTIPDIYERE